MRLLVTIAAAALLSACPSPSPVAPDGGEDGSLGAGGSPGMGGSVVVDAGPDVVDAGPDVAPAPACTTRCCRVCTVLQAHDCPEGRPTASGAQCEERCQAYESGPNTLRMADVSVCVDLVCIRTKTKTRRAVACQGGR
jgi:hypothetical protein